jgi:hypothetical protein
MSFKPRQLSPWLNWTVRRTQAERWHLNRPGRGTMFQITGALEANTVDELAKSN